jgi:hypothetical protein
MFRSLTFGVPLILLALSSTPALAGNPLGTQAVDRTNVRDVNRRVDPLQVNAYYRGLQPQGRAPLRVPSTAQAPHGNQFLPSRYLSQPFSREEFRKLSQDSQQAIRDEVNQAYGRYKHANDRQLGASARDTQIVKSYTWLLGGYRAMGVR